MLDVYALACVVVLSAVLLVQQAQTEVPCRVESGLNMNLGSIQSKDRFEQRPSFAPTACRMGSLFIDGAMGSSLDT